jgi:hypothetical protein
LLGYLRADFDLVVDYLEGRYAELYAKAITSARVDDQNATLLYEAAGRAALWAGDVDALRTSAQELRALGRVGGYPRGQLGGMEAGLLALTGRGDEAAAAWSAAIRELDDLRLDYVAAMTRLDAVRTLGTDRPVAARWAADARATFERLHAQPLLDRLDQVAAPSAAPSRSGGARQTDRSTEATRA